jgi:hypothetical protein
VKGAIPASAIMTILLPAAVAAQSLEQQREIVAKKAVTLGDACLFFHGIHTEGNEETTPQAAFDKLVGLEIAPAGWKERLGDEAGLGEVSLLICATLKVKGGVTARLFGMSPRLAYKECARAQIVRRAGPHSRVSGYSLQGIAGKVQDLLEK